MSYATDIKVGRQTVVRDALNNGSIELVNGASVVQFSAALEAVSGTVAGEGLLTLAGFPKSGAAVAASTYLAPCVEGRLKRQNGNIVKSGLGVCLSDVAAPAWQANGVYAVDAKVTHNGNQYRAIVGGTAAASGGPSGTGASIVDGGVTWAFLCQAGQPLQLSSLVWGVGDTVSIQANPTLLHAA